LTVRGYPRTVNSATSQAMQPSQTRSRRSPCVRRRS